MSWFALVMLTVMVRVRLWVRARVSLLVFPSFNVRPGRRLALGNTIDLTYENQCHPR